MKPKLPKIVKDLNSLTLAIFRLSKSLPKHLRPTIASRVENLCLDSLLAVRRFALSGVAIKMTTRHQIHDAIGNMDAISTILELALDLRVVSDGAFGEISVMLSEVRRQLHGLRKKYDDIAAANS